MPKSRADAHKIPHVSRVMLIWWVFPINLLSKVGDSSAHMKVTYLRTRSRTHRKVTHLCMGAQESDPPLHRNLSTDNSFGLIIRGTGGEQGEHGGGVGRDNVLTC